MSKTKKKKLTSAERRIWEATYAAAFVSEARAFAKAVNTSPCGLCDDADARASIAESALGLADNALESLRELGPAGLRSRFAR